MKKNLNIKRDERSVRLAKRLDRRRKEGKFDFTIIVGDQKIYAERNVLACGSEYFDRMFSHPNKENQDGELNMKEVDFECVKACIDFIYMREIFITPQMYGDLMLVARMLLLDELCDAVEENMYEDLHANSFFAVREMAIALASSNLENKCESFAEENFDSIAKQNEFKCIERSFLKHLLSSKKVEVDEERKLQILLDWVRFDTDRNKDMMELLQCIEISKIPHDIGEAYITKEPLINTNCECLLFFTVSILKAKNSLMSRLGEFKILLFDKNQDLRIFIPADETLQDYTKLDKPNFGVDFSAVTVGNYIYVLCENQSVHRIKNSMGSKWEKMSDMLAVHGKSPPAAVVSKYIYVIGGHKGHCTNAIERYNHFNSRWERLENKPIGTMYAELLTMGNFIYTFGGCDEKGFIDDVSRFDPATSQWKALSCMNIKKAYLSATAWKDMIYVMGGYQLVQGKPLHHTSLERYEPPTDQWTTLPEMNIARSWLKSFSIDGVLYAVGGMTCDPTSIEKYDIETGKWKVVNVGRKGFNINTSVLIKET